jgi:hypothetical protein
MRKRANLIPMFPDYFAGTWNFNSESSELSSPHPKSWVQRIGISDGIIEIEETIVSQDASTRIVSLRAKFDGSSYPVQGSAAADAIRYDQIDDHTVAGTGTKNGAVTLKETVSVSPDRATLTLNYFIYKGLRVVASGKAVFERQR